MLPSLQYLRIGDPGVGHVCVTSAANMKSRALREREQNHYIIVEPEMHTTHFQNHTFSCNATSD